MYTTGDIKKQGLRGKVWFQQQWVSVKALATDGCTGVPELGLTECCNQHDADYTPGSGFSRLSADWRLCCCVFKKGHQQKNPAKKVFYWLLAPLFFTGVRVAGSGHYQKVK